MLSLTQSDRTTRQQGDIIGVFAPVSKRKT